MKKLFLGKDGKLATWVQLMLIYLGITIGLTMINLILGVCVGLYIVVTGGTIEGLGTMMNYGLLGIGNLFSIVLIIVFYKSITRKTLSDMGLKPFKQHTKEFGIGLLMGVVFISVLVGILTLTGNYQFEAIYITPGIVIGLILFITVGFNEEMFVRGVFQHIIQEKHKVVWAVLLPSVLFSWMHFNNPNINILGAINLLLAGILFGVMTYKTGNLWMAIGYHITWNFTMGNIYGIEVSGLEFGKGLIQMNRVVDNALNGGKFGLEGGYLCTIILSIMILGILFGYRRKENA